VLPFNIEPLVSAKKRLNARPVWDGNSDRHYFTFLVPLIIEEGAETGFELRSKVSKIHIDRDALMQLEYGHKRSKNELIRCQWRPFETHVNKAWGPPGHELESFDRRSHAHTFEHNYLISERRMRGRSLPAAIPIEPDPTSLSDFFAFCGEFLKISNIGLIEPPSQSPDMFWDKLK